MDNNWEIIEKLSNSDNDSNNSENNDNNTSNNIDDNNTTNIIDNHHIKNNNNIDNNIEIDWTNTPEFSCSSSDSDDDETTDLIIKTQVNKDETINEDSFTILYGDLFYRGLIVSCVFILGGLSYYFYETNVFH